MGLRQSGKPGTFGRNASKPEDSLNTARTIAVLETLSWTFKSNHEYERAAAGRVLTQGTYGLGRRWQNADLHPSTRNNINRYIITVLNENELVLNSGFRRWYCILRRIRPIEILIVSLRMSSIHQKILIITAPPARVKHPSHTT